MANARSAVAAAIVAALVSGCGGGTTATTELTGPTQVRCATTLSGPPALLPHAGTQSAITVHTTRDCAWTASADAAWLTLQPLAGQGEATIATSVAANPDIHERSANVVVNEQQLLLRQEAAPCTFTISPTSARLNARGGRVVVQVRTVSGCAWEIRSPEAWVRAVARNSTGSGIAELSAGRNTGGSRTAEVIIAGLRFILSQNGATR
jgi:hypothetical protein